MATRTHPCLEAVTELIQRYEKQVSETKSKTNDELRQVAREYKMKLRDALANFDEEALIDTDLSTSSADLDELSARQKAIQCTGRNGIIELITEFKQGIFGILQPECPVPEHQSDETYEIFEEMKMIVAQYTMRVMEVETKTQNQLQNVAKEYKKCLEQSLQTFRDEPLDSIKLSPMTDILEKLSDQQKEIKCASQKEVEKTIAEFKREGALCLTRRSTTPSATVAQVLTAEHINSLDDGVCMARVWGNGTGKDRCKKRAILNGDYCKQHGKMSKISEEAVLQEPPEWSEMTLDEQRSDAEIKKIKTAGLRHGRIDEWFIDEDGTKYPPPGVDRFGVIRMAWINNSAFMDLCHAKVAAGIWKWEGGNKKRRR